MTSIESLSLKPEAPITKSETPTKTDNLYNFIPRETNKVQQQELSKRVYSIISNLHGLICDWKRHREKGFRVCRAIAALDLPQYEEDYFPSELKPLMNSLVEVLDILNNIVEEVQVLNKQLQALSKLQSANEQVLVTWSVSRISEVVKILYENIKKEYCVLQNSTEIIGHSRDGNIIGMHVAAWKYDSYVTAELYAYLFSEAGLTPVTM